MRLTTVSGGSSEDPLGLSVDLLEGGGSAFVEDVLGGEALIFIVVVCVHAVSELLDLVLAELVENGLAGGALILSWEAMCKVGLGHVDLAGNRASILDKRAILLIRKISQM